MSDWRPLLSGADAERARAAMTAIADELCARPLSQNPSLARGQAGIGLGFAHLARVTGDEAHADEAARRLELALEMVGDDPGGSGLWMGLAGVVFAAEQAASVLELELEDDPYGEVDQLLIDSLSDAQHFELMTGIAGLGVYALERARRPAARALLERVADLLRAQAAPRGGGLAWFTRREHLGGDRDLYPDGYHSLGVAHGTPGAIGVLAAAAACGIDRERTASAAEAGLAWLWQQRVADRASGWFPGLAEESRPHRAAWCYGDAGIAGLLAAVAPHLPDAEWMNQAGTLGLDIAMRPPADCRIGDPTLCHGAFGLAHILNRLYQRSGAEPVAEAARDWFRRALDMARPGRGIAGFSTVERDPVSSRMEEQVFEGILDGAMGMALALAAATSEHEPQWDRAFLVSLAPLQHRSGSQMVKVVAP